MRFTNALRSKSSLIGSYFAQQGMKTLGLYPARDADLGLLANGLIDEQRGKDYEDSQALALEIAASKKRVEI
jgi:hypothetical protein